MVDAAQKKLLVGRVRTALGFIVPLASLTYLSGLVVPIALAGWRDLPSTSARAFSEENCRPIFDAIAAHEAKNRQEGKSGFPDEPWSADDHRAAFERDVVRGVAADHHVTLPTAYLCFDEGIRRRWPGANGQPLDAKVAPLDPRRR